MKAFALTALTAMLVAPVAVFAAETTIKVPVNKLAAPPVVDGKADEWGKEGWQKVLVKPALEHDEQNNTGELEVSVKTGVAGDRFFMVASWPDEGEDRTYKTWKWSGNKYKRGKERDDMLAIRFHMDGEYDKCMLAPNTYRVDVWVWSAGRSDLAGFAEDFVHLISTKPLEESAEYTLPGTNTMVYIQKPRDEGNPMYEYTQPTSKEGEDYPGVKLTNAGSGSLMDVTAKGVWANGKWTVELSRKLDTGHKDDVSFLPARTIKSALAVFNKGYGEHKSTTAELVLDFSGAM
ncbi:MAG: hypothetical protein G8345_07510 [Magnetococcales bacterium]|nr:hypothetical protein [Magnetococcales bacterium]NGZ26721.1 hypothetical protein [Magnetococcales bacterium]